VPQLQESVADATLVAWHKQPGDAIRRDENLADLETDKVVLEVPAPAAGILKEIHSPAGSVVKNGDLLAVLEAGASAESSPAAPKEAPAAQKSAAPSAAPKVAARPAIRRRSAAISARSCAPAPVRNSASANPLLLLRMRQVGVMV